jgi:restriction endonuclease S subunit
LSHPAENTWGVLKTTSVQMGEYLPEYNKELPKTLEPKVGLEVNDGDFLVTTTGPRNRCGVVCHVKTTPKKLIFSGKILRFRADENQVLASWVMYLLMSPSYQKVLDQLKVGTSDSSVSIGNQQILDLEIPVASIDEQKKIVEILDEQLSRLDATLASVNAVREKSARFRRSLLHAAFTGALTGHDTSDGTLPPGWEVTSLGDVAKWGSGGTPKSGTAAFYGGPIRWAVIGDLTESLVSETAQSITKLGLEKSSAKVIAPGTVMLAMYGASIGRTGIAAIEMATNQAIAFAVPQDGLLDAQYLLKYLQSQKENFVRAGQGGAQPNISQTVIKPWPMPLPPMGEQEKIVQILEEQFSRLEASLEIANAIETKASNMRRSLLHAAFTGDLTKEWREGAHV